MQNAKPTAHTEPLIIKPYAFPDTISNPITIPAIDPELDPELDPPPRRCIPKSIFTAEDLERLIRLVAEKEPWTKPHGERTKAWESVLRELQSGGGHFEFSSVATLRNKVDALISWKRVFQTISHENFC